MIIWTQLALSSASGFAIKINIEVFNYNQSIKLSKKIMNLF